MTISKKLLLLATLSLTLGSHLGASDCTPTTEIQQQNNEQAQIAVNWLGKNLLSFNGDWYFNTDALELILHAHLTPAETIAFIEKIAYISKLKTKAEEERKIKQKEKTKKILATGLDIISACITISGLVIFTKGLVILTKFAGQKITSATLGA
ncbi:MAG TPA: hypothetical protein VKR54_02810 [Candidatus Babeliales bacterium]|jgi:hypothetical protein|nr:hypothetical protein [Candidatus Babeliales bacterium]